MEVINDEGLRFRKAWYLILYLAPIIACVLPVIPGKLWGLSQPWEFWSQAPAGAERMLGETFAIHSYESNDPWPTYIRTQDGQLYERFVEDGEAYWDIAQLEPTPEDEQMGREFRPWEPPPMPRPFVPFVLNPPPGRVIDSTKDEVSVGEILISIFPTTDRYFALLADGSIWSWEDPVNHFYGSALQAIGQAYTIGALIVAIAMVRRLNRTNGRPRIWRRGFTTARDTAFGVALFMLLCLILAPVVMTVLGMVLIGLLSL